MSDDAELQQMRAGVSCAAVLENMGRPWKLDVRESTRRALKYRRDQGEVFIITHEGRGWWDPQSTAKGDVFTLAQHLVVELCPCPSGPAPPCRDRAALRAGRPA